MESEMRTDVELLIALCDDGATVVDRRTGRPLTINAKALSLWSGLSLQTISDYKTGKYNIPISFWRSILDRYVEPRIVSLLIPDGVLFEMMNPPASMSSAMTSATVRRLNKVDLPALV